MVRFDSQGTLEKALLFAYGHIKRQRELNGWKDLRITYYIGEPKSMTLVGTWEPSRCVGWISMQPWVVDGQFGAAGMVEETFAWSAFSAPKRLDQRFKAGPLR